MVKERVGTRGFLFSVVVATRFVVFAMFILSSFFFLHLVAAFGLVNCCLQSVFFVVAVVAIIYLLFFIENGWVLLMSAAHAP